MLESIIAIIATMLVSDADAEGLRVTAPQYLTLEQARDHTAAARIAGIAHSVDPDLLLATALKESNYRVSVTYRERSGNLSCGVVQSPGVTLAACNELNSSLLLGYLGGAAHLRKGINLCRGNVHCGLSWYAGGQSFVKNCRENRTAYKAQCATPSNRIHRAKMIREQRKKAGAS